MDCRCNIQLLGDLRIEQDGRVIARFRSRQTGALLAYLAFYLQRSHPRELLMELIWPGQALEAARDRLRVALSSLRRQLEPPGVPAGAVIRTDWRTVQLNPAAVTTDVAVFEAAAAAARRAVDAGERAQRLTEAMDEYRGELLPGYYEDWIVPERHRLADLYFLVAREMIRDRARVGDLSGALDIAGRAVASDPLREEAHQELIRLLAAAGQPAAAISQFRRFEGLVTTKLGEPPSEAIRQLAAAIERQEFAAPEPSSSPEKKVSAAAVPAAAAGAANGGLPSFQVSHLELPRPEFPPLRAEPGHRPRLPYSLTRFFGREAEIAALLDLLRTPVRLVTLVGPGGSGKTRLALAVAERVIAAGQEAVSAGDCWWVSLVDVSDTERIGDAMHQAISLPRSSRVPALDQVVEALNERDRPALLVLDNFEQLVEGGALLLRDLLERVPALQCLVTSRQLLNLDGERKFLVAPLPVPSGSESPEELTLYDSVRLFVDRAQAIRPDFQVTHYNAPAVAELCHRLEGIPLAIELAAARVQMLTPVQMLPMLALRFDLLVSRQRDRPARHQTLRAAIDWSYRLLSPELQRLFARLSVFRGGWTLEAAADVCSDSAQDSGSSAIQNPKSYSQYPEALEGLTQLQQSSLVVAEEAREGMRYRMLDMLREYAAEQLDPHERAAVSQRHARHFRELVEVTWPRLRSTDGGLWLDRLERELDNFRSALDWCAASGEVETGLVLAARLTGLWMSRGYEREGLARLTTLLALPGSKGTAVRCLALTRAGAMADGQGHLTRGKALHEESLAVARALGNCHDEGRALNNLGCSLRALGDKNAAREIWQQYLTLVQQTGDRGGVAIALSNLSSVALDGDLAGAQALAEECVAISREIGHDHTLPGALTVLGDVARRHGDRDRARSYYDEVLGIGRRHGNGPVVSGALDRLARLARDEGDVTGAKVLYRESLAICRHLGRPRLIAGGLKGLGWAAAAKGQAGCAVRLFAAASSLHADPADRDAEAEETVLTRLRAELGEAGFAAAWAEGRRMPLDEIITAALSNRPIR